MKLTATTIKTLALPPDASDKTYFDDDLPGFGVRLRRGGSRKWVVQYDFGGKTRKFTLGAVAAVDLGEARKRAKDILAARTLGRDPVAEKQEARARASETFGALLPRYLAHKAAQVRPRSLKEIERHLLKYARPLHARPVAALDRRAVAALVATLVDKSGPVAANNAHASLSGYFDWLLRAGLIDGANPVSLVNKPPQTKGRDRVISDGELREIWSALGNDDYGAIVKLLAYTAARKTEIGNLTWDEVDFEAEEIRLPASRTKGKRPHVIPLVSAPLAILKARQDTGRAFVFGRGEQSGFQGWPRCKAALDAHVAAARKAAGITEPMPGWVLHDMRRFFSTTMHDELGAAPHVVEACLGHIGHQAGIAGTYNKALYLAERRRALERWAEHIEQVVSGKKPGTIVNLRKR